MNSVTKTVNETTASVTQARDEKGSQVQPDRSTESPVRNSHDLKINSRGNDSSLPDFPPASSGRRAPDGALALDPAAVASILMGSMTKLENVDMVNLMKQLNVAVPRKQAITEEKLKKLDEAFKKQQEKARKEKDAQTASDVQLGLSVFFTVASILLAIATAGLASGLAIAATTISATMTGLDVANRIGQAAGAEYSDPTDPLHKKKKPLEISLSGMVNRITEQMIADGTFTYPPTADTPEKKEKYLNDWKMGWGMALTLAVAFVGIGCGAGALKLGTEGAKFGKAAADLAKTIADKVGATSGQLQVAAQSMELVQTAAESGVAAYMSFAKTTMAFTTYDMRNAENAANRLDAFGDLASAEINRLQGRMKSSAETMGSIKESLAETAAMMAETNSYIIAQS